MVGTTKNKPVKMSRRYALKSFAAIGMFGLSSKFSYAKSYDVVVIGAGVFGVWTALHLLRAGKTVLLVDAYGPGHTRSSSGGESRMIRAEHGKDRLLTEMALASLKQWKSIEKASSPIFFESGSMFMAGESSKYIQDTIELHKELGLPTQLLSKAELAKRYPQMNTTGIHHALLEPKFGAIAARRAVQETAIQFVSSGGEFERAQAIVGKDGHTVRLNNGRHITTQSIVCACGPWLGKLFPQLLLSLIKVTRQEYAFFGIPPGNKEFLPSTFPGWADLSGDLHFYGFPDLEERGFKIAQDYIGPEYDPDLGDRRLSSDKEDVLRTFVAKRFPALAEQPLLEGRVCQYAACADGDFIIDRHPNMRNIIIAGAGSGHGFKHGPEVGRLVTRLITNQDEKPHPRFAISIKSADFS